MKMNRMMLLAVILGFTALQISAWTHRFENSTPYTAKFKVAYAACDDEIFFLPSGQTISFGKGICSLRSVKATVDERTGTQTQTNIMLYPPRPAVVASPYNGPYSGGSEWVLAGPVGDGRSYYITRKVQ